jgi:hypothetical protein
VNEQEGKGTAQPEDTGRPDGAGQAGPVPGGGGDAGSGGNDDVIDAEFTPSE